HDKQKTHDATQLLIRVASASWGDPEFPRWLADRLQRSEVSPQSIIFQLNERDAARHMHQAQQLSLALRKMGCGMALADFGLALNPMEIAARLGATLVKLDRHLTLKADSSDADRESLTNTLKQLKEDNYRVIAPFAETAGIIPVLWQLGV